LSVPSLFRPTPISTGKSCEPTRNEIADYAAYPQVTVPLPRVRDVLRRHRGSQLTPVNMVRRCPCRRPQLSPSASWRPGRVAELPGRSYSRKVQQPLRPVSA